MRFRTISLFLCLFAVFEYTYSQENKPISKRDLKLFIKPDAFGNIDMSLIKQGKGSFNLAIKVGDYERRRRIQEIRKGKKGADRYCGPIREDQDL